MSDDYSTVKTIAIQLTQGYKALIDVEDSDLLIHRWHTGINNGRPYAYRWTARISGVRHLEALHRVIYARIENRALLSSELVDHQDNDPLNNTRGNLRLATHAKNGQNRKKQKNNTSGYKGVTWVKSRRKWRAYISAENKRRIIGEFDTPQLAYVAYCKAAKDLHGEFARLE